MGSGGWVALLASAALAGIVFNALLLILVWSVARGSETTVPARLWRRLLLPTSLLGAAFATRLVLPLVTELEPSRLDFVRHCLVLALIVAVGWSVMTAASLLEGYLKERFPVQVSDNLGARRIHTRFHVLRRLVVLVTLLVCGASALMTFPGMRTVGAGLLASAGVVGIVLGVAARPTVEAFIAGIQLAWTQPIRLDDVVVVEGEWGRIEEIAATYVVVRLWDLRRLIVPLHYLLSQPFQNWTRDSAELLGSVTVEVDYRTPVDRVRERVGHILGESSRFDGGFWNLQVVDAGPQTMRLRVLVAAPNADTAWELRCELREKLIEYLQSSFPDCLPRVRAEVAGTP